MELLPTQQVALLSLCALYILLVPHHFLHAEKVPEGSCCGYSGMPGTPGHNGLPGRDGNMGEAGPKGEKGDPGTSGAQGLHGKLGPAGPAGRPGPAGPRSMPGPSGEKGEKGSMGLDGISGQKGDQGPPGPPGPLPAIDLVELQSELKALRDVLNKVTQFTFTKRVGTKYFLSDKKSGVFEQAVAACSAVGGVPALPKSQEENQALIGMMSSSEHAWLSANDRTAEGTFVDLQGTTLGFSNWKKGEPNNHKGVEDCTITDFNGSWNDVNCDLSSIIICEI
ncbi:hypothetical protein COCON_G00000390 [Conger conger]|uniref:C-type lectin domain-containing protein n=1 Tax=Conger conger TaxID=82655 RepID=A0A9Q1E0E6_CONCO|nr:mannose-binding protein C-like [Conger conger]KAJ8287380.1 hypothetical protein COCON_G00000390 [Conger conger]